MIKRLRWPAAIVMTLGALAVAQYVWACPFCTAISTTLSEDIDAAAVAVIVRLTKLPGSVSSDGDQRTNSPTAQFAVDKVLKGEHELGSTTTLSAVFFGDAKPGELFLMMGNNPPKLEWSPPMRINQRQHGYILSLMALPKEGPERLKFFQDYLEETDSLLSRDSYDEFARASYTAVKQLKPHMNHDQLVKWISDPEVPASRRRLYLTMLGVCGNQDDIPLVEQRLRATDAQSKSGLDATIACYLTLRGAAGVDLIEDLFLKKKGGNFSDNYADVYAAIMALRFHGIEGDIVPRERVVKAFGCLLDNPQMADLVIADLARWEDWSQLQRLVELFKNADPKATWVRIPIINFARACPHPAAKEALAEFEKIDPEAIKRSMTFFPSIREPDE